MKRVLLGSSALICLGLSSFSAQAACSTTTPVGGQSVDCTGTSTTPIQAGGVDGITVTLEDGSVLDTITTAIELRSNSAVRFLGNGAIRTTGNDAHGIDLFGSGNNIELNNFSTINTYGQLANGINDNGGTITLNDNAQIRTFGLQGSGIQLFGASTVVLNDNSLILTSDRFSRGINASQDSTIILNDDSAIQTSGQTAYGIEILGRSLVQLNDASRIKTEGTNADGIEIRDTGGNTVSLNGQSTVTTYGGGAEGIYANVTATGTIITLSDTALLHTLGAGADGIDLRSDDNFVGLGGSAQVTTAGNQSTGIQLLGDRDTVRLGGSSVLSTSGTDSLGINLAGTGAVVQVTGSATASTSGNNSHAIQATGDGNTVVLSGGGQIVTSGAQANAIVMSGEQETVGMLGQSQVRTSGIDAIGISIGDSDGTVILDDSSRLSTIGLRSHGIQLDVNAVNSVITLRDQTLLSTAGNQADGILLFADTGLIQLNDASRIVVTGNDAAGIRLNSDSNSLQMTGTAAILADGTSGTGVAVVGDFNQVNLDGQSTITATGATGQAVRLVGDSNTIQIGTGARVSSSGSGSAGIVLAGDGNVIVNFGSITAVDTAAILGDDNAGNNDAVINLGRIATATGTSTIALQAGDDTLALGTGSQIDSVGVDGGNGDDNLILFGTGSEDNVFTNFENLQVGVIAGDTPDWSLTGDSTFGTKIDVVAGRLGVNATLTAPVTNVQSAGILGGNGTLVSDVTSVGTIAAGNSVGTLTINGDLTQTGGAFVVEIDKSGVDRVNVLGAGGATLAGGVKLVVTPLNGNSGGAGIILHADSGITGTFGTVDVRGNGAATLVQGANDITLVAVDGTPLVGGDFAAAETGLDYMGSVAEEILAGLTACDDNRCTPSAGSRKRLWAKGFGRFGSEAARDGNQPFDFRIAGSAVGGDIVIADGLRLGLSGGYSNTTEDVAHNAASTDIDTTQAALYATYQQGAFFVAGQISGGWQDYELSRHVSNGDGESTAETDGWLFGGALQAGARLRFPDGWTLTPSAGIAYQHQWVDGYSEHGGGDADVAIDGHQADALRLTAQLEASQTYQLTGYTLTPHATFGLRQQFNLGGQSSGTFSDGSDFTLDLIETDRVIGLAGIGLDLGFESGLSTYVNYDAALSGDLTVQSVTGGLRYSW